MRVEKREPAEAHQVTVITQLFVMTQKNSQVCLVPSIAMLWLIAANKDVYG